jgi:membrane peptidoglycan carboxypeptidase
MHYCLAGSVAGTGGNARISGQNVYGKTGTTASNKDRWFCGYTEYYTAAVWFGFDTPEVINLVASGTNPAAILFSKVLTQVHQGLPKVQLIDYNKFGGVTMCLDSGKVATGACTLDVRTIDNINRTSYANVYPEDRPRAVCDKHVLVDYCITGGGVCSEYCKLFAGEKEATGTEVKIEQKALVKMTQKEIDELIKAKSCGLMPEHLRDDYIYLINIDGTDGIFKGIEGKINKDVNAPYLVCPLHTKEAWEAYQESIAETEPETEPTEPGTPPAEDDGAVG